MEVRETEDDPYQICSIDQLNRIRDNSGGENYLDDHFVLTTDLDFLDTDGSGADYVYSTAGDAENAKGWIPIGHDTDKDTGGFQGMVFSGSFDGGGYVIRNLVISRPDETYVGAFGRIGGSVKDLGLEGVIINGNSNVGGLTGYVDGGTVTSCYATGQVVSTGTVGGLVGFVDGGGTMASCYSTAQVEPGDGLIAGGLVGQNLGIIISCFSTGTVTGTSPNAGGFVGVNSGEITSCYSTGNVTGALSGGFAGRNNNTITSCYSTGTVTGDGTRGGFAGANIFKVLDSFWDTEASGITTAGEGTGKTTTEMKALTQADLGDADGLSWDVGTSDQYPALKSHREDGRGTQMEGYLLCDQPGQGDDPPLRAPCGVSIAAVDPAEFPEGSVDNLFVLTRKGAPVGALTVQVSVSDGGAGFLSSDPLSLPVVMPEGDSKKPFTVVTLDDDVDEADGTLTATLPEDDAYDVVAPSSADLTSHRQ